MARRGQRQVFVELPPPPAEKWRWTSLSPVKVKNEEEDDVIFLGERTLPRKRSEKTAEVKVKIEETAEELKVKEQKVKVEAAAIVLSEDSLRRRLDRLPQHVFETELTDEEQMHTITRQLFTDHYEGGHNQFTFFNVRGRALGSRETRMMCPNRVMNPYSPRIPGSHGLFMDAGVADDAESDGEKDDKDEKPATKTEDDPATPNSETKEDKKDVDKKVYRPKPRLAVLAHIAPGHWRYVGHYDMFSSEPLTGEEWREQTTKFKAKWTSVIFREMSCYSMRQRVWHRKQLRAQLKRDPTKEEVRAAVEPLSRPDLPGLTVHDIELAFEKGELRIYINALCFVEYREKFQRDLIKISVDPEPRVKRRRPKSKPKLKRKRADSDEDDNQDDGDYNYDDEY